jgi:hypothetical protein
MPLLLFFSGFGHARLERTTRNTCLRWQFEVSNREPITNKQEYIGGYNMHRENNKQKNNKNKPSPCRSGKHTTRGSSQKPRSSALPAKAEKGRSTLSVPAGCNEPVYTAASTVAATGPFFDDDVPKRLRLDPSMTRKSKS